MRSFCVSSVFTMPWMTRIASRRCESSPKQTYLNHEFPRGELKNYHTRKIWVSLCGPAKWKVMPRNVWNDFVSWQTGRQNNSTKYQLHALRTIISKRKNWNPWDNCQKYALKLCWNADTWHVPEDLIFYGPWTNLHGRSQNGPRIVINGFLGWSHTFILHVSTLGNTAKQCRLGLFQDSDFAGHLEDSKSTSGGTLCIFGCHTFVPISRMCKTSVSHSSTESEISSDAGLRLDCIPALDFVGSDRRSFLKHESEPD